MSVSISMVSACPELRLFLEDRAGTEEIGAMPLGPTES